MPLIRSLGSAYTQARQQWIGEEVAVSGAGQNTALMLAVADLERARPATLARAHAYRRTIRAITRFAAIPITGVTARERLQVGLDITTIDNFFSVPSRTWNRNDFCLRHPGPAVLAAARQWSSEPFSTTHGVRPRPLRRAADDLSRGRSTDSGNTSCYTAAIADLDYLAATPDAVLASSPRYNGFTPRSSAALTHAEIGYLNGFFAEASDGSSRQPLSHT